MPSSQRRRLPILRDIVQVGLRNTQVQRRGGQIAARFHPRQAGLVQTGPLTPPGQLFKHVVLNAQLLDQRRRQAGAAAVGIVVRCIERHRLLRQIVLVDVHHHAVAAGHNEAATRKLAQVDIFTIVDVQHIGIELNLLRVSDRRPDAPQRQRHTGAQKMKTKRLPCRQKHHVHNLLFIRVLVNNARLSSNPF